MEKISYGLMIWTREPGDVFASLCGALKLSWVVEGVDRQMANGRNYPSWRWMSIGEGRNRYRSLIAEAEAAARAAKFPETAAA